MIRQPPLLTLAASLLALAACLRFAPPAAAQEDRVRDLERKVDALRAEVEELRRGESPDSATGDSAARPRSSRRDAPETRLGGYGEMLYENFDRKREDGAPSAALDRIDFLRLVLRVSHRFDRALTFDSEVQLEHTGVQSQGTIQGSSAPLTGEVTGEADLSGSAAVEYAWLQWSPHPLFGIRAGLLLVPLGWTNERHEPTEFFGTRRPEVEELVIPTTWSANGAGVVGELTSGLSYRVYMTEGLNGARFAADGIREGRQQGSQSLFTQPAVTGRLDYLVHGQTLGASFFSGNTWQDFQPTSGTLAPRLSLIDAHGRFVWRALEVHALYAHGSLTQASELSDALRLTGSARLGETSFGASVEAAYDLLAGRGGGGSAALLPYVRWEDYQTQHGVPGGTEDPSLHRRVWSAGAAFRPHPEVVVKADRQWRSTRADTGISQWNVALGCAF